MNRFIALTLLCCCVQLQTMDAMDDATLEKLRANKRRRIEETKKEMVAIQQQMVRIMKGQDDASKFIFIPADQNTAEIHTQNPEKTIITIPLRGAVSKILGMTIVGPIMLLPNSHAADDIAITSIIEINNNQ